MIKLKEIIKEAYEDPDDVAEELVDYVLELQNNIKRIKFDVDHLDDVADAITRQQIRSLITANTIRIKQIVGTSREFELIENRK